MKKSKKSIAKLRLARKTLRRLECAQLRRAAGATKIELITAGGLCGDRPTNLIECARGPE